MPEIALAQGMSSLAWLGLVHALWLGLAAPALVVLALKAGPGLSLPARHSLLLGAFLLATVGPFVVAAVHREAARNRVRGSARAAAVPVTTTTGVAGLPNAGGAASPSGSDRPGVGAWVSRLGAAVRPWVLACWATGLSGMAGMVLLACRSSRRLVRQCRPAPEPVRREARRLGRALGLRRCPPVLTHDALDEPCLCGVIRPSVLLPSGWVVEASPRLVAAVLAHELAHARRLDPLAHLTQRFLEALVLFHPGSRRLSRALRLQREHRADALAVRLTGDPWSLAEALEGFARVPLTPRPRGPLGVALGGDSSSLLSRIQEILAMKSEPEHTGPWPPITLAVAGLLAFAAVTGGLAAEGRAPARAAAARPAAALAPADGGPAVGALISYEVRALEGATLDGCDPDFVAGGEGKSLRVWFLSQREQQLLTSSGRLLKAPKVTAFAGSKAIIRFPHKGDGDRDDTPAGTSVELTGEVNGSSVRFSARLAEADPGAGSPEEKQAGARDVTCTLPNGGTVMLGTGAAARGRERLILVTPRRVILDRADGRSPQPEPGRNTLGEPHGR